MSRVTVVIAVGALACGRPDIDTSDSASTTQGPSTTDPSSTEPTTATDGTDTDTTEAPPPVVWDVSLTVDEDVGAFFNLWGPTADDVIAVGGQVDAGVIYRYDGDSWTPDEIGFPVPRLNWIHGVDGRVVVVGHFGYALHLEDDGTWLRDPTGTDEHLWGLWGASGDDLWAVGGSSGNGNPPVILHNDGEFWVPVPYPPVDHEGGALFKVWGSAADDVFAVGDRGLILHYNGSTWALEESGTSAVIIGIWGNPSDVVVAGGRSAGIVAHRLDGALPWDGRAFPEREGFDGVTVDAAGVATVVGRRGFIGRFPQGSLDPVVEDSQTQLELHSVFETADGGMFAVGGFFDSPPYNGIILERPPAP